MILLLLYNFTGWVWVWPTEYVKCGYFVVLWVEIDNNANQNKKQNKINNAFQKERYDKKKTISFGSINLEYISAYKWVFVFMNLWAH